MRQETEKKYFFKTIAKIVCVSYCLQNSEIRQNHFNELSKHTSPVVFNFASFLMSNSSTISYDMAYVAFGNKLKSKQPMNFYKFDFFFKVADFTKVYDNICANMKKKSIATL